MTEVYYHHKEDGTVVQVKENDGWTFLKHGDQRRERDLDPNDPSDAERIEKYWQWREERRAVNE